MGQALRRSAFSVLFPADDPPERSSEQINRMTDTGFASHDDARYP